MLNKNKLPERFSNRVGYFPDHPPSWQNYVVPPAANLRSRPPMVDDFKVQGYRQLPDTLPTQRWFDALYAHYDQLIDVETTDDRRVQLDMECQLWQQQAGNITAYAGAPVGFRDRRLRPEKELKTYFQFNREFGWFMKSNRGSIYYKYPLLRLFCDNLMDLCDIAEAEFRRALFEIDTFSGGLTQALWGHHGRCSVLLKVLCYEPSADWATSLHFDKSAFTLVANADDIDQENFRIAPFSESVTFDDLTAPDRRVANADKPSTGILFPGMCLKSLGLELMPSPHGVVPISTGKRRHSLIAFLIAPDVDTAHMTTDLDPKTDAVVNNA